MIFDALVTGHVRSNLPRALVSVVAIALGVAAALTLWLSSSLTLTTLDADRALFASRVDFQILPYGRGVSDRVLADVRYVEGIDSAAPIIEGPVELGVDPQTGTGGISARLVGSDVLQPLPGVSGFEEGRPGPFVPTGAFIDPAALIDANGAILSAETASRLRLQRGSRFALLANANVVSMNVANVLPANVSGIDSSVTFVDVTTAQRILSRGPFFDRIDIVSGAPREAMRARILAALRDRGRLVDPAGSPLSLGNLSAALDATFGTLAAIALAVGGLLVFNAVGTSITHRRGDIGTMRALGVAPHQIVATFVLEGAGYGAVGSVFGVALGAYATRQVAQATNGTYDANASNFWPFAFVFFLGVAIAGISALVPALSAVAIAPAIAARQGSFENRAKGASPLALAALGACALAVGVALGYHPSPAAAFVFGFPLCFAAGGALLIPGLLGLVGRAARRWTQSAPAPAQFAARTLGAMPKRVGIAFAALTIAVCASVTFEISSGSFERALAAWAAGAIAGDLIVSPAGATAGGSTTFARDALVRARATPGVRAVAAMRTVHTRSGALEVALRGDDDFAPSPQEENTPSPAEVSSNLAAALHVARGDALKIRAPHRDVRLRVAGVRPDFSAGRGEIVVARRFVRETFGDDGIDALRVTIGARADLTTVRTALTRSLAPARVTIVTTRELREHLASVFAGTFRFARALGIVVVAIAVFGIASALAAIVFERRFELRMLRRIGASRGTIAAMLFLESLTVASCASILGLGLGIALAAVILEASDPVTLGFALPIDVPAARIALALVATIAAGTLGTLFSLPAAFRIATDGSRKGAA